MKKKRRFRTKYLLLLLLFFPLMAESPQAWLVSRVGVDAYTGVHFATWNIGARIRSSETINGWFGLKTPSNWQIVGEVIATGVLWEVYQYHSAGGWDGWCDIYGGARPARLNTIWDLGADILGGILPLRDGGVSVAYNRIEFRWEI